MNASQNMTSTIRPFSSSSFSSSSSRFAKKRTDVKAAAKTFAEAKNYNLTLLPGDGIGPEIMRVAKDVLNEVGRKHAIKFTYEERLVGGAAIDAFGTPLPEDTL